jgi:hypothetical protein
VHIEPLFATWDAEWELLGAPVWLFLAVGSVAAFLVSRFSPLPVAVQHRLSLWLPALMLLGCLFTRWIQSRSYSFLGHWYFYKFYYAHLDTAFAVSFAFGLAFTFDLLQTEERRYRIVGWSFVPVYVGLLAAAIWYIHGWYVAWSDTG